MQTLCPQNRRVAAPAEERVYLMREASCPAILVECGFISNPEELRQLLSPQYQTKLAAVLLSAYLQRAPAADGMTL